MGLVASMVLERTTLPTMRRRWRGATDSPGVMPVVTANSAVSIDVSSSPPFLTKSCRCATPSQVRPGRMSSV